MLKQTPHWWSTTPDTSAGQGGLEWGSYPFTGSSSHGVGSFLSGGRGASWYVSQSKPESFSNCGMPGNPPASSCAAPPWFSVICKFPLLSAQSPRLLPLYSQEYVSTQLDYITPRSCYSNLTCSSRLTFRGRLVFGFPDPYLVDPSLFTQTSVQPFELRLTSIAEDRIIYFNNLWPLVSKKPASEDRETVLLQWLPVHPRQGAMLWAS